jgi:beta-galactosidase
MPKEQNYWRAAGDQLKLISTEQKGNTLVCNYTLPITDTPYTVTYTVLPCGALEVTATATIPESLPEFSRFGMKMDIPKSLNNVTYYGRGPGENYSDRQWGSNIGRYSTTVDSLNFEYIRPQENGYRTDVREVTFVDANGNGLRFEGVNGPICFNARRNHDEDFDPGLTKKQMHTVDIDPRKAISLNIDLGQAGVGGTNSWGARPLDKYRMRPGTYTYTYRISPIK